MDIGDIIRAQNPDEDEMCTCGHHRWAHANWQMQMMVGFCHFEDEDCPCTAFTSAISEQKDEVFVIVGVPLRENSRP